jgi:hypothetical protein
LNRFCVFQFRILANPNLSGLQRLNVRGLQALGAADDFEFDRLAVVQGLVAIRLNRGKMYEYIFPGLALDETKALAGVKPLHCSLFFAHFVVLFSLIKLSGALRLQLLFCVTAEAGTKKGREFDPRPLYNFKGDTRATNAKRG